MVGFEYSECLVQGCPGSAIYINMLYIWYAHTVMRCTMHEYVPPPQKKNNKRLVQRITGAIISHMYLHFTYNKSIYVCCIGHSAWLFTLANLKGMSSEI